VDPIGFVRATRPFGSLSERELEGLAAALEVVYVPRGAHITDPEGSARYVYLVRKGVVRVHKDTATAHLEEAEVFGGQQGAFAAPVDAWAEEDSLLYRWPAHVVEAVRRPAAVAPEVGSGELVPVADLVRRPPVWVPVEATCGQAAQRMAREGVSSVLVVAGTPEGPDLPVVALAGILTDRDLRTKVLARGLGAEVPVASVMSSPVHTVDASTPTFAAVLRMLELGVHHLPVVRDGKVVGMVTDTDLVRLQAHSPLFLLKRLEGGEVGRYGEEVARTASALLESGVHVEQVCRAVAHLHQALYRRVVQDAHRRVGPAPVPYAWAVCGSEGREEQVLPTDQDNFLVAAEDGHEGYFQELAGAVGEGLAEAGFPPCPGGYMATRWHLSLGRWLQSFRAWLADPQAENLLAPAGVLGLPAGGGLPVPGAFGTGPGLRARSRGGPGPPGQELYRVRGTPGTFPEPAVQRGPAGPEGGAGGARGVCRPGAGPGRGKPRPQHLPEAAGRGAGRLAGPGGRGGCRGGLCLRSPSAFEPAAAGCGPGRTPRQRGAAGGAVRVGSPAPAGVPVDRPAAAGGPPAPVPPVPVGVAVSGRVFEHVQRALAPRELVQLPWREAVYWCVDLETTGLDPRTARIVAVGAVPVREGTVRCAELYATRVRPGEGFVWGGAEAHHLLPGEVEGAPALREVLGRLDAALREGVLVVHQSQVELPVLRRVYRSCGMPWPRPPVVDTVRLLQHLEHRVRWLARGPVPLDLSRARQYLGLPAYPRHDAASDAVATAELFVTLAVRLGARTVKDLVRWGGVP
jgi:CBS domain-containing protein